MHVLNAQITHPAAMAWADLCSSGGFLESSSRCTVLLRSIDGLELKGSLSCVLAAGRSVPVAAEGSSDDEVQHASEVATEGPAVLFLGAPRLLGLPDLQVHIQWLAVIQCHIVSCSYSCACAARQRLHLLIYKKCAHSCVVAWVTTCLFFMYQ